MSESRYSPYGPDRPLDFDPSTLPGAGTPAAPTLTTPDRAASFSSDAVAVPASAAPPAQVAAAGFSAQVAASAQAPAAVPSVVTDVAMAGGSQGTAPAVSGSGPDWQGLAPLSLASASFMSSGWHVVPSAANEYGPGLGEFEFKIDLAGDYQWDWFFA